MSVIFVEWLNASLANRIAMTLVHFLWQGMLIAICLWFVGVMLRNKSANARYAVFLCGFFSMFVCAAVTFITMDFPPAADASARDDAIPNNSVVESEPPERNDAEVAALANGGYEPATPTVDSAPVTQHLVSEESSDDASSQPPKGSHIVVIDDSTSTDEPSEEQSEILVYWWRQSTPFIVVVYLLGVALFLSRLLLGLRGGWKLRRHAEPLEDPSVLRLLAQRARALRMRATPALCRCRDVTVPTVVGVLRPTILLPMSLIAGLSPDQLQAVLTHELAHIRRYDHLVNILQRIVEAVLFFHPAVWWVSRRIRLERENCCDDVVLKLGAGPVRYAELLVDIAEHDRQSRPLFGTSLVAVLKAVSGNSQLSQRVQRMLGLPTNNAFRLSWGGLLGIVLAGGALIQTVMVLNATSEEPDPSNKESQPNAAVTLPSGMKVELAGVTHHPSQGHWWRADGSKLDRPLYEKLSDEPIGLASRLSSIKPQQMHELTFRIVGDTDQDVRTAVSMPNFDNVAGGHMPVSQGNLHEDMRAIAVWSREYPESATARFGIAAGPWKRIKTFVLSNPDRDAVTDKAHVHWAQRAFEPQTIQSYRVDNDGTPLRLGILGYDKRWPTGIELKGTDIVVAADRQGAELKRYWRKWAHRIRVIDREGRVLAPRDEIDHEFGQITPVRPLTLHFDIQMEEIARVELLVMPYHWCEFRNISLRPGRKTEVKTRLISVAELPVSEPVGESEFQAGFQVADQPLSPRDVVAEFLTHIKTGKSKEAFALTTPHAHAGWSRAFSNLKQFDRIRPLHLAVADKKSIVVSNRYHDDGGRDEVFYAILHKQDDQWRIHTHARTTPEKASLMLEGFALHPGVRFDVIPRELVGRWRVNVCEYSITLNADGTGTELPEGPAGPAPGAMPDPIVWHVNGSRLVIKSAKREKALNVEWIDGDDARLTLSGRDAVETWARVGQAPIEESVRPSNAAQRTPSNREIAEDRTSSGNRRYATAWGETTNGIRVGVALRNRGPVRIGSEAQLELLIQNRTDEEIEVRFPSSYYMVAPTSIRGLNGAGSAFTSGAFDLGAAMTITLQLKPNEIRSVEHPGIAIVSFGERTEQTQRAKPTLFAEPGDYEISQGLHVTILGNRRTRQLVPSGVLSFRVAAPAAGAENDNASDAKWSEPLPVTNGTGWRVRVRPIRTQWSQNETPELLVDLWNDTDQTFHYPDYQQALELEFDGKWYRWADPVEIDRPVQVVTARKTKTAALTVSLGRSWALRTADIEGSRDDSARLTLNPGKHTIRIAMAVGPIEEGDPVRLVSGTVEIEIVADDKADHGHSHSAQTPHIDETVEMVVSASPDKRFFVVAGRPADAPLEYKAYELSLINFVGKRIWKKAVMIADPVIVSDTGQVAMAVWKMVEGRDRPARTTPGPRDQLVLELVDVTGNILLAMRLGKDAPDVPAVEWVLRGGKAFDGRFANDGRFIFTVPTSSDGRPKLFCVNEKGGLMWKATLPFVSEKLELHDAGNLVTLTRTDPKDPQHQRSVTFNRTGKQVAIDTQEQTQRFGPAVELAVDESLDLETGKPANPKLWEESIEGFKNGMLAEAGIDLFIDPAQSNRTQLRFLNMIITPLDSDGWSISAEQLIRKIKSAQNRKETLSGSAIIGPAPKVYAFQTAAGRYGILEFVRLNEETAGQARIRYRLVKDVAPQPPDRTHEHTATEPAADKKLDVWGNPVEGVQARLRTNKQAKWSTVDVPELFLDVSNNGSRYLTVAQSQKLYELVVDGRTYRWVGAIRVRSSAFPPGRRYDDIPVTLTDDWEPVTDSPPTTDATGPAGGEVVDAARPLRLAPGEHTIRFAVTAPATTKTGKDVRFQSNPLEIEIVAPDDIRPN